MTRRFWFQGKTPIAFCPDSSEPLVFRHYQAEAEITVQINGGKVTKTMAEWLRFAGCHWHTALDGGADPFGGPTLLREWNIGDDPLAVARQRIDAMFELMGLLGIKHWTFHTLDLIEEGANFAETKQRLMALLPYVKQRLKETGIKVLWVTAKLFAANRYMNGAMTGTEPDIWIEAGAQIKLAIDIAHELDAAGVVFWGGREGYETLLNTMIGLELENLATMLRAAVNYKAKIGFKGQFYIEPKAQEPTTHQYDYDVATVVGFLRDYALDGEFMVNFEPNHGSLAKHTTAHEMAMINCCNVFGSIDANQGTETVGWDTDEFPCNLETAVVVMLEVLKNSGFTTGGLNFDAKLRRASTALDDLFMGFIMAMDTYAAALKIAARIINDGILAEMVQRRYCKWSNTANGVKIANGDMSLEDCEELTERFETHPVAESGHAEFFKTVWAAYLRGDAVIPKPTQYQD